jgi:hypothetical protein
MRGRTIADIHDEESSLLREDTLLATLHGASPPGGLFGQQQSANMNLQNNQANSCENILFYDEHIEEDGYNFNLIDELFLNPKRKTIRIYKERQGTIATTANQAAAEVNDFSRIDTEEDLDSSDSSI